MVQERTRQVAQLSRDLVHQALGKGEEESATQPSISLHGRHGAQFPAELIGVQQFSIQDKQRAPHSLSPYRWVMQIWKQLPLDSDRLRRLHCAQEQHSRALLRSGATAEYIATLNNDLLPETTGCALNWFVCLCVCIFSV